MDISHYNIGKRQLVKIHNNVLKILNDIGIEVPENIIPKLSGRKGVKIEKNRVKLNPSVVDDFIEKYKNKKILVKKQNELILRTIGHTQYFLVPETDEIKPISEENLIEGTKLIDTLYPEGIIGCAPGRPQELPPKLQSLAQYKISCLYSRNPSIPSFFSIWEGEYIAKMYEVITGKKMNTVGIHIISPLKMIGEEVEIGLHFIQKGIKEIWIGTMPTCGATAPIFIPMAFSQAAAEVIGASLIFKILSEEKIDVNFTISVYPFDMKYGCFVYGSAEHILIEIFTWEINKFYGRDVRFSKAFHTMAKLPDIQCGAEQAAFAMIMMLLRAQTFSGAGSLCIDEIWSHEKLMIDREIFNYIKRVKKGIEFKIDDSILEIINEGVKEGHFLNSYLTVKNYRDTYWIPDLFEHEPLGSWKVNKKSVREKAYELFKSKIKEYCYELEREKRIEIEKIYNYAKNELQNK